MGTRYTEGGLGTGELDVQDDRTPARRIGGKLAEVDDPGALHRKPRQHRDPPRTALRRPARGPGPVPMPSRFGVPIEPHSMGVSGPQTRAPPIRLDVRGDHDPAPGKGQLRRDVPQLVGHVLCHRRTDVRSPGLLEHQDVGIDLTTRLHHVEGPAPTVDAAVHVVAGDDNSRHWTGRLPSGQHRHGDPGAVQRQIRAGRRAPGGRPDRGSPRTDGPGTTGDRPPRPSRHGRRSSRSGTDGACPGKAISGRAR